MHFGTKSYLKSTHNHTAKQALRGLKIDPLGHDTVKEFFKA
jgi:hypothetical protein